MVGQTLTGWYAYNDEQREHQQPELGLGGYLGTGHFLEATAENWESEFLQMAAYVLLTVFLFQRGSAESKRPRRAEAVDRDPRASATNDRMPRGRCSRGGWTLRLYENSLSLAFVLLFLISFVAARDRRRAAHNDEALAHGGEPIIRRGSI